MILNEWSTLKKAIVGVADYANIPQLDISYRTVLAADKISIDDITNYIISPPITSFQNSLCLQS